MSTFGLVIPGRPVDTNFQLVDSNKFLITIANADNLNHVVVFLTGLVQLPPEMAASIFFSLPDPSAPPTWHYLGYITTEKPSAIFRLTNITQSKLRNQSSGDLVAQAGGVIPNQSGSFQYPQAPVVHVAQIGISVEPLAAVAQMVPAAETAAFKTTSFAEFINKTVGNLYNYCSSFGKSASELTATLPFQQVDSTTQYVPLATIQNWYENYLRRLSADQNFWKTLN